MDETEDGRRRRAAAVEAAFPHAWKASKPHPSTGSNWTANMMANTLGYVPEVGLGRHGQGQTSIVKPPPDLVSRQPDMVFDRRLDSDVMRCVGKAEMNEQRLGAINYLEGIAFTSGGMFQGEPSPDWRDLKKEQRKNGTDIALRKKRRCEKVYAKRAAKAEERRRADSTSNCGRNTPPYFSGNPTPL